MKIGFIGLGHMGRGMAANLIKAGHEVTVFNRTPGKAGDLEALGAKVAGSIAEACSGDAVTTMLSNDQAVESVVFDDGGILASLPKGAIHISSSTISVALSDRLAEAHRDAGQRYVAATVLGRPEAAAAGELLVIVAGAPDALAEVAPLLDAIGRSTTVFGDTPSAANLVKLASNFLTSSVIESLGEAIALTSKGNIDKRQFLDFLIAGNFNAPVYRIFGQLIVADTPAPAGFAAPLAFKDIRLAIQAGENLKVPMPFASVLHDRFVELLAKGGEQLDWSALGRLSLEDAAEDAAAVEVAPAEPAHA
jgi:3-hydroxyisobutyrate dehydrogenase-like beta-hydroxyacid dehydrogenase